MARRITIRKRGDFLYLELALIALAISYALTTAKHLHPVWGVIIFFAVVGFTSHLFFRYKFFMYLFSLAFSIGWSCIGFGIVHSIDKKTGMVSGSVVALLIFAYSLWFHKDYFEFRRNASVSEIERL